MSMKEYLSILNCIYITQCDADVPINLCFMGINIFVCELWLYFSMKEKANIFRRCNIFFFSELANNTYYQKMDFLPR